MELSERSLESKGKSANPPNFGKHSSQVFDGTQFGRVHLQRMPIGSINVMLTLDMLEDPSQGESCW